MTKTQVKVFPLYSDLMFKYILGTNKNAKFTVSLLESFLNIEIKDIKIINSLKLDRTAILNKKFETDIYLELPNKEKYNLEMYTNFDRNAEIKSVMYITSIFSNSLKVSEDYNTVKRVAQINFVKSKNYHAKQIRKFNLLEVNDSNISLASDLLEIYVINVESKADMSYNLGNKTFQQWLKLINAKDQEEMEKIVKGNKIMEEVLEEMQKFSNEDYVQDYHAKEVLIRSQHNSEINAIKEQEAKKVQELEQNYHAKEVLIRSQHNSEINAIKEQEAKKVQELEQTHKEKEIQMKKAQEDAIKKMLLKGIKDVDIIEIMNISNKELKKIKLKIQEA